MTTLRLWVLLFSVWVLSILALIVAGLTIAEDNDIVASAVFFGIGLAVAVLYGVIAQWAMRGRKDRF